MAMCFLAGSAFAGTGVVTVTANGGSCLGYTPHNGGSGPDTWEVAEGGSYTMIISGVTECSGTDITIFIQSSNTGNFCFTASGGNGTYVGNFTMPNQACFTMPVSYKCGANQPCNNANTFNSTGPDGATSVHLRANTFSGGCSTFVLDDNCDGDETHNDPIISCPSNNVTQCDDGGNVVTFSVTAVNDGCDGEPTVSQTGGLPSGSSFPVGTTVNTFVATDDCGGSATCSFTVTIKTKPTVSISAQGGSFEACSPGCVTLNASGADSYIWSNGATTSSITVCENSEVTVTGTTNGCSSTSAPATVTIHTPPTVTISANGPTTVCSPACVTLNANGATTYVWSTGATTASIQACSTNDYSVTGTDAHGCSSSSAPTHVTINPPPTVSISANGPTTVCSPACVTLNSSGTATSFVWSNGATTSSIQACSTGSYSVVGTNSFGCSTTSNSISVTVNPRPTCSLSAPNPLPVCGLGNNNLSVSINGAYSTIVWGVTPSSWVITSGQGTTGIKYTAGASGTVATFTVTVTNSFGCSSSCTVSFGSRCEEHCGYTQGFYGSTGKVCDGSKNALAAINAALGNGPLVSGIAGNRSVTILTTEGSCLNGKMPSTTTPVALPSGTNITCAGLTGTWLNSGKIKNVLLGQTITLGLNVRNDIALGSMPITGLYMTTYKASSCTNGVAVGSNRVVKAIPQAVLNCLASNGNNTVQGLLNLANQTLAGTGPCAASISAVNDAVDAINNGFDGCRILAGFGNSSAGLRETQDDAPFAGSDESNLELTVYPNPTSNQSDVLFRSPVAGQAALNLFDMSGQKVAAIYNDVAEAGELLGAQVDVNNLAPGIYLLSLVVGDHATFQKIVVMK